MIAEPAMDRRPSPGLTLNLSSNNPFRNRATSPGFPSPALNTPSSTTSSRPMSRNPFLQTFEAEFNKEASNSQLIDMSASMKESPKKATFGNTAEELFNNLTLDEGDGKRRPPPPRPTAQRSGSIPLSSHRPSRSDEDEKERPSRGNPPRGPPRHRGPPGPRPSHQNSPERREHRRPRRNSESSMVDKGSLDPNEERRRRERRRERDERSKDGKSRSGKVRKPHGLDVIDKLDVSGIYGPSLIHHDGPYDAVQPHRNRKKDHRAPMHAFPAGSANNALGGSGPLNDKIDLDRIHGRGAEGFTDFSGAGEWKKPNTTDGRGVSFNPKARADIVHGEESNGLGTSTFLEGAPASRAAIQKDTENQRALNEGGLGRKKSIAQRFRGISQPRRGYGEGSPRITSPEARYGSAQSPISPHSAGGSATTAKSTERNPFFNEYDEAYDKKTAAIKIAEAETKDGPVKSPTSPGGRNPLARSTTADGLTSPVESKPSAASGFLNRVKSLKGGRRPRPPPPN